MIDTGSNMLRRNSNHLRKSVIKHEPVREADDELPETGINQDNKGDDTYTQDSFNNDNYTTSISDNSGVQRSRVREV